MDDKQLSPHFWLSEFTRSQAASRLGQPIIADALIQGALQMLCTNILEPVRDHFGRVDVSSGYRPPWLNESLPGTAKASQHQLGEAADFHVPGVSVKDVTQWIADSDLPFDQLIYEFGESGWTHASYSARMRREVLSAQHGPTTTIYLSGIVDA